MSPIMKRVLPGLACVAFAIAGPAGESIAQEVVANAATLASGLSANGHVVVHGIVFEPGKADIRPESDAALKEVAKALQRNPGLKLYVVDHTDNAGTLTANVDLSVKRAVAVVKVLSSKYGVAPERLQAFGSGPYSPVTSNDDEDGRSLNRRIELVRQ